MAVGVSNQVPDVEHLEPMLKRIATAAGDLPHAMTADADYWSVDNAKTCAVHGRRFLLQGLQKVDEAWHLIAATHNLLRLFRHRRSQQQTLALASG